MIRRPLILAAVVMMLAACSGGQGPRRPSGAGDASDAAACTAAGGAVRPVCRLQRPMCVVPYKDAGKRCTDDKQCGGGCVYDGAPIAADGATTGICRKDNDPCGCIEHIKGGRRVSGVCVD